MMLSKSFSTFLLFSMIALAIGQESCKNSYNCPSGTCCRTEQGSLLMSSSGGFGFGWFEQIGQNDLVGTCQTRLGQLNEICGEGCGCDEGLTCYRPMSGACCPPQRCYKAEWVAEQIAYWSNCRPPTCFYPARDSLSF